MQYETIDLTMDQTAAFLGVTVGTVRRRLASKELRAVRGHGYHSPALVRFVPHDDWLRVDDAAGMLGVATSTARAAARRGDLAGRHTDKHRWQVQLLSVLEDPRCDPAKVALFTGGIAPERPAPPARPVRTARLKKDVFFRIDADDTELLERARERHGTYEAAIVAGLRAIEDDEALSGDQLGELRVEAATNRDALERERAAHSALRARAGRGLVDEVYCPTCERVVPIEEIDSVELDDGTHELFHGPHGHRQGSRLRSSTVVGRRRPAKA